MNLAKSLRSAPSYACLCFPVRSFSFRHTPNPCPCFLPYALSSFADGKMACCEPYGNAFRRAETNRGSAWPHCFVGVSAPLIISLKNIRPDILWLCFIPMGLFSYMAYLWLVKGDPLYFSGCEQFYQRRSWNCPAYRFTPARQIQSGRSAAAFIKRLSSSSGLRAIC